MHEFINLTYNYTLLNLLSEKKNVSKIEIIKIIYPRCQNMLILNSYEIYLLYCAKIYKIIKDRRKRRRKNCSSINDLLKTIFFQNLYVQ